MKLGRNDPCSCGSGKKYKRCCLNNLKINPKELLWQRIHSSRDKLSNKILKFAVTTFGKHAIQDAWEEYHEWEEINFDPESHEVPTFLPWFFYHWYPDFEDKNEYPDPNYHDFSPAKLMLKKKSYQFDDLEKRYIQESLCAPFSFFTITSVSPGSGYILHDIFREKSFDVVEKLGSKNVQEGDIIMAKTITIDGLTTIEATGHFAIPPLYLESIIKLRNKLKKRQKIITDEFLFDYDLEIIEMFHALERSLFNPTPPQVNNTDGDPVALHNIVYKIDCANEVFEKLHDLDLNNTKEELLQGAQFDLDKNIQSVIFCWSKKHQKDQSDMDNTVLAHLEITQNKLKIFANSQNRAEQIKNIIDKRLKNSAKHHSTVIESIEKLLEDSKRSPQKKADVPGKMSQEELIKQPKILEHLSKLMTKHWEDWLTTKLPALDDKTPEEATKSKDGKKLLESLITQFERDYDKNPQPGMDKNIFYNLRTKLQLNK